MLMTGWGRTKSWCQKLGRSLRQLVTPSSSLVIDSDMDEEMRAHVALRTQEYIEAGMLPEEARHAALRQFGWAESIKETCREQRRATWLEHLSQDVRFGARQLRKNPGFTTVVVLTLALGIGGSTAIYSVINAVMLNPVPGPEPDRLLQIGERSHGNKDEPMFAGLTTATLEAVLKTKPEYFAEAVWHNGLSLERKADDFIENLWGTVCSPNFFAPWKVRPVLGRGFLPDDPVPLSADGKPARDAVMVLSHAMWQSRFGGNPAVLGQTFEADGCHFTIIGVMPPHFQFPAGGRPTFWTPASNPSPREHSPNNRLFVRLAPGVTIRQTQAMLDVLSKQLLQEFPRLYDDPWRKRSGGFALQARPLSHAFTRTPYGAADLRHTLWSLLAAIGFVLLIACVNVANLMLARTEQRQHEFAVRAAVGAGRLRLARQLLTESLLLAALGALAGLVLTLGGLKVLVSLIPESIPRLRAIEVDLPALGATLALSLGVALAFGLVPAWHAGRSSAGHALKQAGAGATISAGWRRYRGGLVVAEVALAVLLLTGAGLMVASVIRLLRAQPGFDPENLLLVNPGLLRGEKYAFSEGAVAAQRALFEELHARFAALPGVRAVGIAKIDRFWLGHTIEGREQTVGLRMAGSGVGESDAFRTMRVPLLAGRYFDPTDLGDQNTAVIVNETMARLCWPAQSALNKRFRDKYNRPFEVVGVVADARIDLRGRQSDAIEPTFFRPYQEQVATGGFGPFLVIRTDADPRALVQPVRDVLKSVESSMTTPWLRVASQTLYEATEAPRLYMLYLLVFAGVGLFLAVLGIYGVLAYSVARRTRELGIRLAIGAAPRQVAAMMVRDGTRLVITGIALGLLAAFWLTRLMRNQLYEVSPTDPVVFGSVVVFLFAVAWLACLVPARRAASINPMVALRHE